MIYTTLKAEEATADATCKGPSALCCLLLLQVADLMAKELRWSGNRRRAEVRNALEYLATFRAPAVVPAAK